MDVPFFGRSMVHYKPGHLKIFLCIHNTFKRNCTREIGEKCLFIPSPSAPVPAPTLISLLIYPFAIILSIYKYECLCDYSLVLLSGHHARHSVWQLAFSTKQYLGCYCKSVHKSFQVCEGWFSSQLCVDACVCEAFIKLYFGTLNA